MRLTQFSDYALRTLLFLGVHRDRLVPVAEVARSYRVSYNHLTKVAALLVEFLAARDGAEKLVAHPGRAR